MRGSIRRVVISVTAAAVATLAPATAQATFPGTVGKIAISGCSVEDCGVFLADPAGSGATQLTHNPYRIQDQYGNSYPALDGPISWTPDGGRLAYIRSRGGYRPGVSDRERRRDE